MDTASSDNAAYWSSSTRFVLVSAVALLSLGDIWRLPYLLATYGGGAFLLVYAAALLLMGLPVLSAQLFIARGRDDDVPGIVAAWARPGRHSRLWVCGAYATLLGAFLLLAAYTVVASWSLAYCMRALVGGLSTHTVYGSSARFVAFARDGERGLGWLLLFVLLLVATTARGLRAGIEPVMRTLILVLVLMVASLMVFALWRTSAPAELRNLLAVNFGALGVHGVLEALYQAFYSLSLGTGVVLALGRYLPPRAPVVRLAAWVIVTSQVAGLLLAWLLSSFLGGGVTQLSAGAQQIFEVLPVEMSPTRSTALWFTVLAIVSTTTGIGLFEPLVQSTQRHFRLARRDAAIYAGTAVALLGLVAQNAFGVLSSWRLFGANLFGLFTIVSTHFLIPASALALCVLVGQVLARGRLLDAWRDEMLPTENRGFVLWYWLLRFPARIALIVVFAYALGTLWFIEWLWGG